MSFVLSVASISVTDLILLAFFMKSKAELMLSARAREL
jgi:hypothetical protein